MKLTHVEAMDPTPQEEKEEMMGWSVELKTSSAGFDSSSISSIATRIRQMRDEETEARVTPQHHHRERATQHYHRGGDELAAAVPSEDEALGFSPRLQSPAPPYSPSTFDSPSSTPMRADGIRGRAIRGRASKACTQGTWVLDDESRARWTGNAWMDQLEVEDETDECDSPSNSTLDPPGVARAAGIETSESQARLSGDSGGDDGGTITWRGLLRATVSHVIASMASTGVLHQTAHSDPAVSAVAETIRTQLYGFEAVLARDLLDDAERATLGAMVRDNVPFLGRAVFVLRSVNQMYYLIFVTGACLLYAYSRLGAYE